jgi:hypothetical protein
MRPLGGAGSGAPAAPPQHPRLETLLFVNLAVGFLMAVTVIAFAVFDRVPIWFFASFLSLAAFLGLGIVDLVVPIGLWRRYGLRSLLVPMTYVAVAVSCMHAIAFGVRSMLAGAPVAPEWLFADQAQPTLEGLANRLLAGDGEVRTHGNETIASYADSGRAVRAVPEEIARQLRDLRFDRVNVDHSRHVVVFGHHQLRRWHEFIFVADRPTRPEPRGRPPDLEKRLSTHWYYREW